MSSNIRYIDKRINSSYVIAACSDIGKRTIQQDSAFWYADDKQLYMTVCDGMGGLSNGEIASRVATDVAEAAIQNQLRMNCENPDWMADAIVRADQAVYGLKKTDGSSLGSGTTFASVYIRNHQLYWASAGDSRVYLFHGHEYCQLTTDLNYGFVLNQQLEAGLITESEYRVKQSLEDALTSYVGMGNLDVIDRSLTPLPLFSGDMIMICSDGIYRTINPSWMCDIISSCRSPQNAVRMTRSIIEEYGNEYQDNYTCILILVNR